MSERPIIEEGTVFEDQVFPHGDVEVLSVWVDEDGETQVRVAEHSPGGDKRTVTPGDIYDRLDDDTLALP